jgi:PAS domain S-box-containing protein
MKNIFFRIAQVQGGTQILDDLFWEVHQLIQEVMPTKNISVALVDEQQTLLNVPYSVDEVEAPVPIRKFGRGLAEYVLRTRKSLLCTPVVYEELKARGELDPIEGFPKIWLGVPLIAENQVIGVLAVQDYRTVNRYTKEQQTIMEFLANQIAKAIFQKRNVAALKQNQQRSHEFIDENPLGQFIAQEDGSMLDCNPAFLRLLGFSSQNELMEGHVNILGQTKKGQDSLRKKIRKTGSVPGVEMKLKGRSGVSISVMISYGATLDVSGEVVRISGVVMPKLGAGGKKKR